MIRHHRDDHIALFMALVDVVVGGDHLFQRVTAVNDRFQLIGSNEVVVKMYIC